MPLLPGEWHYLLELSNAIQWQLLWGGVIYFVISLIFLIRSLPGGPLKLIQGLLLLPLAVITLLLGIQTFEELEEVWAAAEANPPLEVKSGGDRSQPSAIRVLQHNLWHYADNIQATMQLLYQQPADLVALEEVSWGTYQLLNKDDTLKKLYPYRASQLDSDLMLLSQWPIDRYQFHPAYERTHYTFHFLEAFVNSPQGPLRVMVVHPPHPTTRFRFIEHQLLYQRMLDFYQSSQESTVLVGDFNSTHFSPQFQSFLKQSGLQNSQRAYLNTGIISGGTWPSFLPEPLRVDVDHILLSPELKAINSRVLPATQSDHLPVLAEFSMP